MLIVIGVGFSEVVCDMEESGDDVGLWAPLGVGSSSTGAGI